MDDSKDVSQDSPRAVASDDRCGRPATHPYPSGHSTVAGDSNQADCATPAAAIGERNHHGPSPHFSLQSLAPRYNADQHGIYVKRLAEAISDPDNKNIAITGRYGAGKSSILDEFERLHKDSTLRLAISTLAPEPESDDSSSAESTQTNRIQKELVKQLIYSASGTALRSPRRTHIATLTKSKATLQVGALVAAIGLLLFLFGLLPEPVWAAPANDWRVQALAWATLWLALTMLLTVVRVWAYGRFEIAKVSAGAATVTLEEKSSTYFDKYLEEIVHFFDTHDINVVILEDLDRFDDPHIFESLRELNTTLNSRIQRREAAEPLRFIYALKDSLFERIGTSTEKIGDDAAAETDRANRTKFFDLVIPVVPFISHRNARELLTDLLDEAGITGIERRLIEIVARHTTDMRLMLNMRNEYLVFAERLLAPEGRSAPDLSRSALFALIAYKTFHLKDFEEVSRRRSDLDRLYADYRLLVHESAARLEQQRREVTEGRAQEQLRNEKAVALGDRLKAFARVSVGAKPQSQFRVGNDDYSSEDVRTPAFWSAVSRGKSLTIKASSPHSRTVELGSKDLALFFPHAIPANQWDGADTTTTNQELERIDQALETVRGADFADLADDERFTLEEADETLNFSDLVNRTLRSELARDLVTHGYVNRNYALYAAQFYGHFTGVDVATFLVQTAEPRSMDIDYQFVSPGAIENLLQEAEEDFTSTISAYNIQIVDHLLNNRDERAGNIVNQIAGRFDDRAQRFLGSYLTSGKERISFVAKLADKPWRDLLTFIVTDEHVPTDAKPELLDRALQDCHDESQYNLSPQLAAFIAEHYQDMHAYTGRTTSPETIAKITQQAGITLPHLENVSPALLEHVVELGLYVLNASNLRVALGNPTHLGVDQLHAREHVYRRCVGDPDGYLAAVGDDPDTDHTVSKSDTLTTVLNDIAGVWEPAQVTALISGASPDAALGRISEVPADTWPALASAGLFNPSLSNVAIYLSEVGDVDEPLAHLILAAGVIATDDEDIKVEDADAYERDKFDVATAILNAGQTLHSTEVRVDLAQTLKLQGPLPADRIRAHGDDLFARLLSAEVVADTAETFLHLQPAGWDAMQPAILASRSIEEFVSPDILDGMVADMFASPEVGARLGKHVLKHLSEFLAVDDAHALDAAARFALEHEVPLPVDQIQRVAQTNPTNPQLTLKLLQMNQTRPTADETISVLTELGKPYNYLTTRHKVVFEIPHDDDHRVVFRWLENDGHCTLRKRPRQPQFRVRLL